MVNQPNCRREKIQNPIRIILILFLSEIEGFVRLNGDLIEVEEGLSIAGMSIFQPVT